MSKTHVKSHILQHAVITRPTKVRAGKFHANVVPQGLPHIWAHASVGVRHFVKDYSLAVIMTGVFLLIVLVAALLRISQQTSLANLLATVTSVTQDYNSLVSNDKADAPVRGNVKDDPTTKAPSGTSSSFAINSGGTSTASGGQTSGGGTGTGGTGGGTTPPPPPPFSAAIGFFRQDSSTLNCTNPNKPKLQSCSKDYAFSAGVNTQNGPGSVGYGWRSNVSGASQDGSYAAASGSGQRTQQKTISISCLSPGSYTMQFVILSPTQVQSSTIAINHNCLGI